MSRADKGKRRKIYRGKPVKKKMRRNGKFVPYRSRRSKDDPIKIWWVKIEDMSKEGYGHWAKQLRPTLHKKVYKPILRMDVPSEILSTKESIEELAKEHLWEGEWLMRGFSNANNKFGCKPIKMCEITITNSASGTKAKMTRNHRLHRYWYWIG